MAMDGELIRLDPEGEGEDRSFGIIEAIFAVLITVALFQVGTGLGLFGLGTAMAALSAFGWRRASSRREARLQDGGEDEDLAVLHASDFWTDLLGVLIFGVAMVALWETGLNHPNGWVSIALGVGTVVAAGAVVTSLSEGVERLRLVVGSRMPILLSGADSREQEKPILLSRSPDSDDREDREKGPLHVEE